MKLTEIRKQCVRLAQLFMPLILLSCLIEMVLARRSASLRTGGLQAEIARTLVAVPGLMRHGLASGDKKNLY